MRSIYTKTRIFSRKTPPRETVSNFSRKSVSRFEYYNNNINNITNMHNNNNNMNFIHEFRIKAIRTKQT